MSSIGEWRAALTKCVGDKAHLEADVKRLRSEVERLRAENARLKDDLLAMGAAAEAVGTDEREVGQ